MLQVNCVAIPLFPLINLFCAQSHPQLQFLSLADNPEIGCGTQSLRLKTLNLPKIAYMISAIRVTLLTP
jgi:hypothetical protein